MKKTLSDSEFYNKDWYYDLPVDYKLAFLYVKDNCDYVGIFRLNKRLINSNNGIDITPYKLVSYLKDTEYEIIQLKNGYWFMPYKVYIQFGQKLFSDNPISKNALQELSNQGVFLIKDESAILQLTDSENFDAYVTACVAYKSKNKNKKEIEREIKPNFGSDEIC